MKLKNIALFFLSALFTAQIACLAAEAPLISEQTAAKYGLTRLWWNQLRTDIGKHRVIHSKIHDGSLLLVTDDAFLHVIDGENGKTIWKRSLGRSDLLTLEPCGNSRMIAIIHGTELLVFDRKDGKLLWNAALSHAPGAGCELGEAFLYVPLISGKFLAFHLEDVVPTTNSVKKAEKSAIPTFKSKAEDPTVREIREAFEMERLKIMAEPEADKEPAKIVLNRDSFGVFVAPSFGRGLIQPRLAGQEIGTALSGGSKAITSNTEFITWATDRGILHIGSIDKARAGSQDNNLILRYQIAVQPQTFFMDSSRTAQREWNRNNDISARPTFVQQKPILADIDNVELPGLIIVGTHAGTAIAVKYRTGEILWSYMTTRPIVEEIVAVGDCAYIPTSEGLHCVNIHNGKRIWFSPGVIKFLSASNERVYGLSAGHELHILDKAKGGVLTSFPAELFVACIVNQETDRMYLITAQGLVQCFAERTVDGAENTPTWHRLSSREIADAQIRLRESLLNMPIENAPVQPQQSAPQQTFDGDVFGAPKPDTPKPAAPKSAEDDPFAF